VRWRITVVSTERIEEFDPRSLGLLGPDQEFQVLAVIDDQGPEFQYVQANLATVSDGVLTFWKVVDRVHHRVATYADGWWGSFRPVAPGTPAPRDEERIEVIAPDEPPQDLDDPIEDAKKSYSELRAEVVAGLKRGEYPEVGGMSGPRKLKDIWEGKGDPDDAGPDADEESWPQHGTREEIDAWVTEQARKEQEVAGQLRVEADAERDTSLSLPDHLRDEETPPPMPDYTRYSLPRTEFIGSDGKSTIRR
jgi:hypothetical protein